MGEDDGDRPLHVFFRGESRRLEAVGEASNIADAVHEVESYIWDAGVGESDGDPLFVFLDYDLMCTYRIIHTHVEYISDEDQVEEFRVFNLFDDEGKLTKPLTMHRIRDAEEGEFDAI